jgi:hypothetical protein
VEEGKVCVAAQASVAKAALTAMIKRPACKAVRRKIGFMREIGIIRTA